MQHRLDCVRVGAFAEPRQELTERIFRIAQQVLAADNRPSAGGDRSEELNDVPVQDVSAALRVDGRVVSPVKRLDDLFQGLSGRRPAGTA
jgi:hypothetical protein